MKHIERILKTSGIISVTASDQLSTALSQLKSSHDAAFVFDDKKILLGVVNPYHAMIRSWTPGKSKVEHHLFHPPHITRKDSLSRIARLMIESKIHYLPVFDDQERFVGITSARRILSLIQDNPAAEQTIGSVLAKRTKPLMTVQMDDPVGKAIEIFKTMKFSKLVVTDAQNKLKGVLSYYDLIPYLIAPGVSKQGGGRGRGASGDTEKFLSRKVRNFAKTTTLTLGREKTMAEVINLILSRGIGSVVIIDAESHPVGIITTRDIFNLLLPVEKQKPIELTKKNIDSGHEHYIAELEEEVQKAIIHDAEITHARIMIETEKNGKLFRISLQLEGPHSTMRAFEKEGKDIITIHSEVRSFLKKKRLEK